MNWERRGNPKVFQAFFGVLSKQHRSISLLCLHNETAQKWDIKWTSKYTRWENESSWNNWRTLTQTDSSIYRSPLLFLSLFFFWRSSNGKKLNNSASLICAHKWEFISIFDFFFFLPFCKSASIKIYLGVQMCWNRLKGNLSALSKHKCRCCEVN